MHMFQNNGFFEKNNGFLNRFKIVHMEKVHFLDAHVSELWVFEEICEYNTQNAHVKLSL